MCGIVGEISVNVKASSRLFMQETVGAKHYNAALVNIAYRRSYGVWS